MTARRTTSAALTLCMVMLITTPASAGPVATNDDEHAELGRVFPEIADSDTFLMYSEFVPAIHYLAERYPDRVSVRSYGESVQGRDLYEVTLTDHTSPVPYEEREKIPMDIALHGRERAGAEGAIRFIEDAAITDDPELLELLETTVVLFTFANPDGWFQRMETMEPFGIRNGVRGNANGVDLNRQWPSVGFLNSEWRALTEPEVVATYELYETPDYRQGRWGHSFHCYTIFSRSHIQLLWMAGQLDLAENLAMVDFSENLLDDMSEATTGLEFGPDDWPTGMYGTVWETRRRINTGFMGGYLAHPEPAGHGKLGLTFEFQGCETPDWNPEVQAYHVEAIRAAMPEIMRAANEPLPDVRVELPGTVGYLFDRDRVRHDDENGVGYEPANEFEESFEQLPYDASRMQFFTDLRRYTRGLVPVTPEAARAPGRLRGLDAFVVTEHDAGIHPDHLEAFVRGGGTLVLTDGAVRTLAKVADVDEDAIVRQTSDPGTDLPRMEEESRDFGHPLLAGLEAEEFYAEQLYEPVPLGFSLDEGQPPWWGVDTDAFTDAGGRIAAMDQRGTVMLGDLSLGAGRVVVIGGLLPQPSEDAFHPYGLADHTVTYTGYQVLLNALDATVEVPD